GCRSGQSLVTQAIWCSVNTRLIHASHTSVTCLLHACHTSVYVSVTGMNQQLEMERLIDIVRSNEILYDVNNKGYKDSIRKINVWKNIAQQVGLENGEAAKAKWKNLRDSYVKFLRTEKTTGKTAKKYKKWPWATQLEFLKPHVVDRQTENVQESSQAAFKELDDLHHTVAEPQTDILEKIIEPPRKKKPTRNNTSAAVINSADNTLEISQETGSRKLELDATEHLFLSHAKTVKSFSKRRQALVKLKISQLIVEAELEEISEFEGQGLHHSLAPPQ
ncbi:hypothetical protein OTU49_009770, partial [Cherax quadricarinatus]